MVGSAKTVPLFKHKLITVVEVSKCKLVMVVMYNIWFLLGPHICTSVIVDHSAIYLSLCAEAGIVETIILCSASRLQHSLSQVGIDIFPFFITQFTI